MKIKCWKCKRESEQQYDNNCCWCGALLDESEYQNKPCPVCGVELNYHSRYGAIKCLVELLSPKISTSNTPESQIKRQT